MDHPRPGLRYVDADELDDATVDFDGLDVESRTEEKLGNVEGFIIDVPAARPVYIVVNAGGWFRSKYFLLPVGHASLDLADNRLVADVPRERIENYPGFDLDEFEKLKDEDLDRMDQQMIAVCCPDEIVDRSAMGPRYSSTHYRTPSWWDASFYRPERADAAARSLASTGTASSPALTPPTRDDVRAERDRALDREREREAVVGGAGDVSPHFGGRAQPGDVLGLETGGEQTHVGETTDDENKRREDAEKAARKNRE